MLDHPLLLQKVHPIHEVALTCRKLVSNIVVLYPEANPQLFQDLLLPAIKFKLWLTMAITAII